MNPVTAAPTATRELPDAVRPSGSSGSSARRRTSDALGLRAAAHVWLSCYVGLFAWSLVLPFVVVGVTTTPICLVGVPFLLLSLAAVRALGRAERSRVALFLDEQIPGPGPRPTPPGRFGWFRRTIADRDVWRTFVYLLLQLPVGIVGSASVLAPWAWGLVMAPLPVYSWALPDSDLLPNGGWWTLLWCVSGIVALFVAPLNAHGFGRLQASLARSLLGRSRADQLETRVQSLSETRSGVVDAADAERRRIERDLHDGAQQRLVALAMNLGRARSRLDTDPSGAAALVAEAHEDAKQALAELRDLARGIHPAVLTDRGLDAALSAVAARSPVPVRVDVDLDGVASGSSGGRRLSPSVEAVAYFVVSEALANVAKHSSAETAEVRVRTVDDRLVVTVSDDGRGGATEHPGGGLAGLHGRVAAVDGRLSLFSPTGGPTTISVEIPCAR